MYACGSCYRWCFIGRCLALACAVRNCMGRGCWDWINATLIHCPASFSPPHPASHPHPHTYALTHAPTHTQTHPHTHTHAPTHIFTSQHSLREALLCIVRKVTFGSPVILNLHKKVFLFVSACISVWACNLPLVGCFHSELTRCKMLYLVCRVSGNVETSFTWSKLFGWMFWLWHIQDTSVHSWISVSRIPPSPWWCWDNSWRRLSGSRTRPVVRTGSRTGRHQKTTTLRLDGTKRHHVIKRLEKMFLSLVIRPTLPTI